MPALTSRTNEIGNCKTTYLSPRHIDTYTYIHSLVFFNLQRFVQNTNPLVCVGKSSCLPFRAHLEGNQRENPFSQGTNGLFRLTTREAECR